MLEIILILPLEARENIDYDLFRDALSEELRNREFGTCNQLESGFKGYEKNYFAFEVKLEDYHNGFICIRDHCEKMSPTPKVIVSLIGKDDDPIQIFPRNDLQDYLTGFEEGTGYLSETEKIVHKAISDSLAKRRKDEDG